MKVLGICGSLQAESGNLRLLRKAATLMPVGVEFEIYEGIDALPFFRFDMQPREVPDSVHQFRRALKDADAVLIASPEYGHSQSLQTEANSRTKSVAGVAASSSQVPHCVMCPASRTTMRRPSTRASCGSWLTTTVGSASVSSVRAK